MAGLDGNVSDGVTLTKQWLGCRGWSQKDCNRTIWQSICGAS